MRIGDVYCLGHTMHGKATAAKVVRILVIHRNQGEVMATAEFQAVFNNGKVLRRFTAEATPKAILAGAEAQRRGNQTLSYIKAVTSYHEVNWPNVWQAPVPGDPTPEWSRKLEEILEQARAEYVRRSGA